MELQILVGAESKEWLKDAEALVNRLEKVLKAISTNSSLKGKDIVEGEEDEEVTARADNEDDEDFAAPSKKKAGKKAKSFDDDEDETAELKAAATDDDEDEEFEKPTKKKAKKLTVDDVNDACKERAADEGGGKEGRKVVLGILKKKFKVESVSELEETQYAAVISAMKS
jgi:hypothetical protein